MLCLFDKYNRPLLVRIHHYIKFNDDSRHTLILSVVLGKTDKH